MSEFLRLNRDEVAAAAAQPGGALDQIRAAAEKASKLAIEGHDALLRTGVQECLDAIRWVHLGPSFPTLGEPLVAADLKADLWTFIGPFVRGDEARGEVPPRITAAAKAHGSIATQRRS